jgi:hypothetical protein
MRKIGGLFSELPGMKCNCILQEARKKTGARERPALV